jgi:tripartite-type tricarboxylate transporter receptor subunit TctC
MSCPAPRTSLGDWKPTETIRIIVPAAAGGSTDVMGRLLAAHLQTVWGQSAVVENRSGGGGTIGTAEVIRQKGDGQTILIGNPGPNAIAFSIFRNLTYKADQLQPVFQHDPDPEHRVGASLDRDQVDPRADRVPQDQPRQVQLCVLRRRTKPSPHRRLVPAADRPFRGAGPALQAALAGDVHILFDNLFPSLPQVQDGKLNGLCVTTTERSADAPDLPTMRESAPELARFDVSSWFSVFLPKSSPPEIVNALNLQIKAMLEREEIREEHRGDGRTRRLRHAAAVFRFRRCGDKEICSHHREGRAADGSEVRSRPP